MTLRDVAPLVHWSDSIPAGSFDFYYVGSAIDVTLVVDARDASGDFLWAHVEGQVELTDDVGGGTTTLESLVVESWEKF